MAASGETQKGGVDRHPFHMFGVGEQVAIATDATGTYTRTVAINEKVLLIDSALGVGTITLPSVALAKGMMFTICTTDHTSDITLVDAGDAAINISLTLSSGGYHRTWFYSDGYNWYYIQI